VNRLGPPSVVWTGLIPGGLATVWQARDEPGTAPGTYRRLSSLTLGVLGLGDIGTHIAGTMHHAFRMRVIGCRRRALRSPSDQAAGVEEVFSIGELPRFLKECDYIVSVLPSTPQTANLLGADALAPCAARKPTLINVGRGDLLDESAIGRALDQASVAATHERAARAPSCASGRSA